MQLADCLFSYVLCVGEGVDISLSLSLNWYSVSGSTLGNVGISRQPMAQSSLTI